VSEVEQLTGISRTTLWCLRRQGKFPQPLQLTPRLVAWPTDDVEAWMTSRPAATLDAAK
jgi:prophage regulatory protein